MAGGASALVLARAGGASALVLTVAGGASALAMVRAGGASALVLAGAGGAAVLVLVRPGEAAALVLTGAVGGGARPRLCRVQFRRRGRSAACASACRTMRWSAQKFPDTYVPSGRPASVDAPKVLYKIMYSNCRSVWRNSFSSK